MPGELPVPVLGADRLLTFLVQLGGLLLLAMLFGRLASRVGLPSVVGELLVGVLIGPSALGLLRLPLLPTRPDQLVLLEAVGQLGVLLLVALTGAYLDVGALRERWQVVARVSGCGVALPLLLGVPLGFVLPGALVGGSGRPAFALFLGVAMCVSAVPVIARILSDLGLQRHRIGQLTLIAGVADDAVGWALLSVVSALATTGIGVAALTRSLGALLLLGLLAVTVGPPLVRTALGWAVRAANRGDRGPEPVLPTVVGLVLLAAAGSDALGLEPVLGAFVCGVLVGSSGRLPPASLAGLRAVVLGVLAPVFFATAGLRLDLTQLGHPAVLLAGLAVLVVAVAGKFGGVLLGARWSRLSRWEGLALGAGLNARGMVEIIVASIGVKLGVLTPASYTIVVLVAIITSLMAPPLLRYAVGRERAADRSRQLVGGGSCQPADPVPEGQR